ncbi:DUF3857 domain-containing protein [Zunongwangia sp. HGR-M22]|uniref:DUF3857 domain-containing protein n=1 Tax=Zunongwangia sp. HGR-M22 TaxID=3015168 RepID=UPI0022DD8B07|nr:DUF3857 domain-containing protein [Zunongwangia sp. HGR-M22]WBL25017.1 DUF3857 domain-containing protein [Zunongwangia sp. HGR-M22]
MKRLQSICTLFACLWLCAISAQSDQVFQSKTPDWVTPIQAKLSSEKKELDNSPFLYLLVDAQFNLMEEKAYRHLAFKILNNDGVQEMSDFTIEFDPDYQSLFLHKINIYRDDQVIDQLDLNRIKTVQRETNLERHLYDGSLSALFNLTDVRVGDIIEYSYTRKGFNPVHNGFFSTEEYLEYSLPVVNIYGKYLVPKNKDFEIKFFNGIDKPKITEHPNYTEYVIKNNNPKTTVYDNNTPAWYDASKSYQVSQFTSWNDVAKNYNQYYQISVSDRKWLRAKAKEIIEADTVFDDPIVPLTRFVQDKIRYLGFENGLSSHKPSNPKEIFNRRYGDCKDKSFLLSELLKAYNIDAHPILVNSTFGNTVNKDLPSPNSFDHCIVQYHRFNKDYFIDPTINNQGGNAEAIFAPDYGYGLILDEGTSTLTKFEKPDYGKTNITETFIIDSIGGPTRLKVETVYSGYKADITRAEFNGNGISSIQKSYLDFYSLAYADIEVSEELYFKDERDQKNTFTVYEEYRIPNHWTEMPDDPSQIYSQYYALPIDNFMFPQKTAKRKSPYYINESTNIDYNIVIFTPEKWEVNTEYYKSDNPYFEYTYQSKYSNARIDITHKYKSLSDHVPAKDYSEFLKAHEKASENISYYLTYNQSLAESYANNDVSDLSWFALFLFLVVFTGVVFLCRLIYTNYDIPSKAHPDDHRPIGGWLILIAIGLCLSPLFTLSPMINNEYFTSDYLLLWSTGNKALVGLVFFEIMFNAISLAFNIFILIIFFKRRTIAPKLIIAFYVFNFVGVSLDTLVASFIPSVYATAPGPDLYKEVFKSLIACIIWIPYFIYSERVKDTFVNTYKKKKTEKGNVENMNFLENKPSV